MSAPDTAARRHVNTIYADGSGIWHAHVWTADNGRPWHEQRGELERMARAAIRDELKERGELGQGYRVRVELAPYGVRWTTTTTYGATIEAHYIERGRHENGDT
jgi:hypothetical protein